MSRMSLLVGIQSCTFLRTATFPVIEAKIGLKTNLSILSIERSLILLSFELGSFGCLRAPVKLMKGSDFRQMLFAECP